MIFVTVGTHEQPFDRLIRYLDKKRYEEEVFIQIGYSAYIPQNCRWEKMIPHNEMLAYAEKADIIITHGGPGSIMLALQYGKVPIVVPRQKQFGEHVNNHQVDFTRRLEQDGKIIAIYEIDLLGSAIEAQKREKNVAFYTSNTSQFCARFEQLTDQLMK